MTATPILTLLDTTHQERSVMSNETSRFFLECVMSENLMPEMITAGELAQDKDLNFFAIQIMIGRLKVAEAEGLKYSKVAVMFLTSLCKRPGDVVLWAHYLVTRARTHNPVTMRTLADDFPSGFPNEEGMLRVWDAQKRPGERPDNALDTRAAWLPAT